MKASKIGVICIVMALIGTIVGIFTGKIDPGSVYTVVLLSVIARNVISMKVSDKNER